MSDHKALLSDQEMELIHLLIDGEASPQQRAEAEALLEESAEARQFFESMRELTRSLDAIPPAPAPGVKSAVLAQIRTERARERESERATSIPPRPLALSPFRRRVVVGFAWAAAAVLVIFVAADRLFISSEPVTPSQAAASMPPSDLEQWPVVSQTEAQGLTLTIRKKDDQYALSLVPDDAEDIELRWDDEKLEFLSETDEGTAIVQRREGAAGSAAVEVDLKNNLLLRTRIDLD